MISLRSGAGLDGLQMVSNTVVFGELDWSPHVMDQVIARVSRDGQKNHVQAFFLTVNDGSDPFVMQVINEKRNQHDGLIEGKELSSEILADTGGASKDRIQEMAKKYLQSIGEEIPEVVEEVGLLKEVDSALRRIKFNSNDESGMQQIVWNELPKLISAKVEREVSVSKKSRLDFLVSNNTEKIVIECKVNSHKRAEVYRQVRRYIEETNCSAVILFAPWNGIKSFKIDNIPVLIIDTTLNNI